MSECQHESLSLKLGNSGWWQLWSEDLASNTVCPSRSPRRQRVQTSHVRIGILPVGQQAGHAHSTAFRGSICGFAVGVVTDPRTCTCVYCCVQQEHDQQLLTVIILSAAFNGTSVTEKKGLCTGACSSCAHTHEMHGLHTCWMHHSHINSRWPVPI